MTLEEFLQRERFIDDAVVVQNADRVRNEITDERRSCDYSDREGTSCEIAREGGNSSIMGLPQDFDLNFQFDESLGENTYDEEEVENLIDELESADRYDQVKTGGLDPESEFE